MRTLLAVFALCSCVAVAACGDDDGPMVDASIDAPGTDLGFDASFPGTPSPDGAGWCCQPAEPSCSCGSLGGFALDPRACDSSGPCDVAPRDHHEMTDAHGCRYYTTSMSPTVCECLCIPERDMGASTPDAGPADDAGTSDDGGVDAAAP